MQKDTNIDNVFKQKAMNFGVKVPSAMFDNIAGDLKKRKKKKRRFIIFFLSLLPVAFVILFAINSFYRNNGIIEDTEKTLKTFQHKDFSKYCFNEKNKAEAKEKAKEADQELDKISQRTKKVTKDKVKEKAEAKDKMNTKEIVKDNADEIKVKDQKNTFDSDFKDKSLVEEKDNLKEAVKTKLDSIPDIIEAVTIIEKTEAKTNSVLDTVDLNSEKTDTLIIDKGPIHTLGDPAGFRRTFTIGFSIGPGRAFRTSDVGLISESFIAQSSDDKAISNFHRNFYIKYQFSERFSFSTGLSFFKIGHIAKFSVNDEYLRFIHAENFGHTSAGFYDLDIRKLEGLLKTNDFYSVDCIRKFEDIRMKINITDIPLSLSYNFFSKNRMNLEFIGGLNMAFLGKSEIEIGINNNYYSVGSMKNLKKSIFGFSTGLNFSYEMYNGLFFRVEPIYRRYFNTVSTSESFKYLPYTWSVNAGFSLSF